MVELMGKAAIEARGLCRVFARPARDAVTAVDGLDLAVLEGEVFGLVGPDGAGKTTTMRMLCGALPPTSGSARVAGFDVVRQAEEVKRRIGYLPQRLSLYGELTVDENLLFQARAHGVATRTFAERRERLLSLSRLGRFRGRQAQHLSGGMRQKLALACALIHEPAVLLLDEPTTGVDPVSRGEFWELLLELAGEGMTVLVTTAYMEEAERCRRVGLMHEGRLLACGTPMEIKREARLDLLELVCDSVERGRATLTPGPGIKWVEVFGDRLHIAVAGPEARAEVRRRLQAAGVAVKSLERIEPGLEDAFFELVRRKHEA